MPSLEDPSTSSKLKRNNNMSDRDTDYPVGYGKPPQNAGITRGSRATRAAGSQRRSRKKGEQGNAG